MSSLRILCYGDSNTWGDNPHLFGLRYSRNVRWPGVLQKALGEKYLIIEEGLGGRTTALDDPKSEGRNGKTTLIPCLEKHNPVDIVILMLGTNDLKERFNQTPQDIAKNIEDLVNIIQKVGKDSAGNSPEIVLLSPAYIGEQAGKDFLDGVKKSKQLASLYKEIAEKYSCQFIDIGKLVQSSKRDGLHLDPDAHQEIAKVLTQRILQMLK